MKIFDNLYGGGIFVVLNEYFRIPVWGFWILNIYREYKKAVNTIDTDNAILNIDGFSTTKTIKVKDTIIKLDEKLERICIARGEGSGGRIFKKEIDDFVPVTVYDPFNGVFKNNCIVAIDIDRYKNCIINGWNEIVAHMLEFIATIEHISGESMFAIDSDKKKLCI